MRELSWKLVPLHTPPVLRSCPRCDERTRFISSDKFRINGQGRRLDVWLIYRCEACKQTWNATLLSRVTPESIEPSLYQAFLHNDVATAWRYAFDAELLKKNQVEVDAKVEYRVEGDRPDLAQVPEAWLQIAIGFELLPDVRLETLLARELGLPRRAFAALEAAGALVIEPEGRLDRRIRRPLVVRIATAGLRAERT